MTRDEPDRPGGVHGAVTAGCGDHQPTGLTLDNYRQVLDLGFDTFIVNSTVVTVITMVLVVAMALPAAYAIVFGGTRASRAAFNAFLLGLATRRRR